MSVFTSKLTGHLIEFVFDPNKETWSLHVSLPDGSKPFNASMSHLREIKKKHNLEDLEDSHSQAVHIANDEINEFFNIHYRQHLQDTGQPVRDCRMTRMQNDDEYLELYDIIKKYRGHWSAATIEGATDEMLLNVYLNSRFEWHNNAVTILRMVRMIDRLLAE